MAASVVMAAPMCLLSLYPPQSPLKEVLEQYALRNPVYSLKNTAESEDTHIAILDATVAFPILPATLNGIRTIQLGGTLIDGIPVSAYIPAPLKLSALWKKIEEIAASFAQEIPLPQGYRLDILARTLQLSGESGFLLHLTDKESALLYALYQAGEQGMDSNRLLSDVWGYSDGVDTHTVQTHIYRLRQKIEAAAPAGSLLPSLIETSDTGYRLG
jgi:hypothetical protein